MAKSQTNFMLIILAQMKRLRLAAQLKQVSKQVSSLLIQHNIRTL